MATNIRVVLPGDSIAVDPEATMGPGIYQHKDSGAPITCRAGMLREGSNNNTVWVDFDAKRVGTESTPSKFLSTHNVFAV